MITGVAARPEAHWVRGISNRFVKIDNAVEGVCSANPLVYGLAQYLTIRMGAPLADIGVSVAPITLIPWT